MSEAQRYDRQLRLWGTHGQRKLSAGSVLCMGSGAVATEVLKSLVLPGIGWFVVADTAKVTERDLGVNFFVEETDVGRPRAQVTAERLGELNPSVRAEWETSIDIRGYFDVVVACNKMHVPPLVNFRYLVQVESIGFIGRIRLFAQAPHVVLEPKADEGRIDDLRIANPWPDLARFANSFDISLEAEEIDVVHVPWLVLLAKAITVCKAQQMAVSRANIICVLEQLRARRDGLNFNEAAQNVYRVTALVQDTEVVHDLRNLIEKFRDFTDTLVCDLVDVLKAVIAFFYEKGVLPLQRMSLPDMTSRTDSYTELVGLFRAQAEIDLSEVMSRCSRKFEKAHLSVIISNLRNLAVIELPKYESREGKNVGESPVPKRHNSGDKMSEKTEYNVDEAEHADLCKVLDGHKDVSDERILRELERYQPDIEMHAVSSVIGSTAAQEIVKLVTNQFTPIDNSYVFNGINGTAFTYHA